LRATHFQSANAAARYLTGIPQGSHEVIRLTLASRVCCVCGKSVSDHDEDEDSDDDEEEEDPEMRM
jgi:hypothetical protein